MSGGTIGTVGVTVSGEVNIDGDDLYGDVQITAGSITGSLTADITDQDLEWDYKLDDLTGMLENQDDDKGSDYLWEWIIGGDGLLTDFLRYFLNQPMNPNTAYLPTVCSRAERAKLLIDTIKAVENLLSEEEEDAAKV